MLHDKAPQAVFQSQGIEIHQQTDTVPAHAQVGQKLRFMDRQQFVDSLDFDNQFARNDDVGAEANVHRNAFIDNGYIGLAFEFDAGALKFEAEASLIDRFEQSRSHVPMQLDCQPNDLFGQFAAQQHTQTPWPSVPLVLLRVKP